LLCLGALGVVFGDIGTSPLYTLKECLAASGEHPGAPELFGILSLIVWSLTMVVTIKYLMFIIHAGYIERPCVHDILKRVAVEHGLGFDVEDVTYYLGRETILTSGVGRMGKVAETLYGYLQRNAVAADRHFGLPPRQVVEIGTQIDL
jgi:K+ transporter